MRICVAAKSAVRWKNWGTEAPRARTRRLRKLAKQVQARVDRVVADLGLEEVRTARVGDAARRGVSGGQRKRCSIGVEVPPACKAHSTGDADLHSQMRILRSVLPS